VGLHAETDSLAAIDSTLAGRSRQNDRNNLVLFLESGFIPYLEPVDIVLPIFEIKKKNDKDPDPDPWQLAHRYVDEYGNDVYAWRADRVQLDHVLRFAFPMLIEAPSQVAACEVVLPGGGIVAAEPALDLGAVAHADFEARLPGILLKTVARAVVKELGRGQAKKKDSTLGALVNALNVATEQADTRGWIFLPRRIHVLEAALPAGKNTITARFLDESGQILEQWDLDVKVSERGTAFASVRSFK
jgi:hypothetical protein